MITIHQLTKQFGPVTAVDRVSLTVNGGELFGFIGPDGAGKTTLLRMVNSLMLPTSGEVSLWGLNPVTDYKQVRTMIGYMPGKFSLYLDLTVEENLQFFASVFGTTVAENYHLIADIYSHIELFKHRKAGQLSGGMKQKLALSCALIHKPRLLILDEPTTGVDAVSRGEFWEMLRKLKHSGITILVSTPYMDEAALCDRVALMQNGNVLQVDTPIGITQGFTRPLFAIRTQHRHEALQSLRGWEYVHKVYPYGETLHYIDHRQGVTVDDIEAYLSVCGIAHQGVQRVAPGIEDRFMELMDG
ncbi:ABC-type multidrug transport system ATPase subunit [Breznakibacter xylanolyticus]|uniref:ABC-type multidrug transport system ATPase subunit n=1 Tax=Breznakibacter xylanolyticus TaxID=990 RepID=A0A2W7ND30_9BACT|nr:ABC transporter ATP-binding protein [Breznakibacter xylanolyticus]PZX17880.1 ABC-type multidrug transport system ATPase subunit [Breznakibacter xylanolyticus]